MPKLHIAVPSYGGGGEPHNEIEQRREGEAGCSPWLLHEHSLLPLHSLLWLPNLGSSMSDN